MSHELLSRLGLRFPFFLAPMAGVLTPEMAAAVSNAGGPGGLGLCVTSLQEAAQLIAQTRALNPHAFNVSFSFHTPAQVHSDTEHAWIQRAKPVFEKYGLAAPEQLHVLYQSFRHNDAMLTMLLAARPAAVSFHLGLPRPEKISSLKTAGIILFASATCVQEAKEIEAAGLDGIVAQGCEAGGHRGVFNLDNDDEQLSTESLTRAIASQIKCPSLPLAA